VTDLEQRLPDFFSLSWLDLSDFSWRETIGSFFFLLFIHVSDLPWREAAELSCSFFFFFFFQNVCMTDNYKYYALVSSRCASSILNRLENTMLIKLPIIIMLCFYAQTFGNLCCCFDQLCFILHQKCFSDLSKDVL